MDLQVMNKRRTLLCFTVVAMAVWMPSQKSIAAEGNDDLCGVLRDQASDRADDTLKQIKVGDDKISCQSGKPGSLWSCTTFEQRSCSQPTSPSTTAGSSKSSDEKFKTAFEDATSRVASCSGFEPGADLQYRDRASDGTTRVTVGKRFNPASAANGGRALYVTARAVASGKDGSTCWRATVRLEAGPAGDFVPFDDPTP